jgi:hypothetical protein
LVREGQQLRAIVHMGCFSCFAGLIILRQVVLELGKVLGKIRDEEYLVGRVLNDLPDDARSTSQQN